MGKLPLVGGSLLSPFDSPFFTRFLSQFEEFETAKFPPVNVRLLSPEGEDKESFYRVDVAVAGYSKEDLTVAVNGSIVTVSGEVSTESAKDESDIVASESYMNQIALRKFSRGFTFGSVPVEVDEAEYKDGILSFDVHYKKQPEGNLVTIK